MPKEPRPIIAPRAISSHLTSQMPPNASRICWDLVDGLPLMGVPLEEVTQLSVAAKLLPATALKLSTTGVPGTGKDDGLLGYDVPAEL